MTSATPVGGAVQQDRELVAAESGTQVIGAHGIAHRAAFEVAEPGSDTTTRRVIGAALLHRSHTDAASVTRLLDRQDLGPFGSLATADSGGIWTEETAMNTDGRVRTGQSCALDPRDAAREFHAAVVQSEMALVVFFCSVEYDLAVMAGEIQRLFAGVQVIGCTTAGEFGPAGYRDHSITGASFPRTSFSVVTGRVDGLRDIDFGRTHELARAMLQGLQDTRSNSETDNSFALALIDGMSGREESVIRALQDALGELPLVGGSAGDGLSFGQTQVYYDGVFSSDSAVLALVTTSLPFRAFKTQHFVPMDQRVVVTAADADRRIIHRIDGLPAAQEYARLVGVDVERLDSMHFARQPMVVLIDGTSYVRSIQKANPDGSLTLFCAIEEGIVLRTARGGDLVESLERAFAGLDSVIGRPQVVIGCDCVLRKLEIVEGGLVDRVEALFSANNVIGFNGYGEQYRGVHVNQTLTGIAIGESCDD